MAFFTAKKELKEVQNDSNYITKSGIYDVDILAAVVNRSEGGSVSIDLWVEYNGQKQMIYGNMRITNNDGSDNKIGTRLFNQLLVIADVDTVEDPEQAILPIGKEGADKEVYVLPELEGTSVKVRIQMEYSKWQDEIQERKVIRRFFREDGASADEILTESNYGTALEKEMKYADSISYRDGLTEEEVSEWLSNNRTSETKQKPATKRAGFGKRSFGKK